MILWCNITLTTKMYVWNFIVLNNLHQKLETNTMSNSHFYWCCYMSITRISWLTSEFLAVKITSVSFITSTFINNFKYIIPGVLRFRDCDWLMTRLWKIRILRRNRTLFFIVVFVYILNGLLIEKKPVKLLFYWQINSISQERKKVVKSEIELGLSFMDPDLVNRFQMVFLKGA